MHAALAVNGKDLGHVTRIVKLMSLVNSTSDFTEQHLVTNGASELIGELFGSAGSAINQLTSAIISISTQAPNGICATPKALRACAPALPNSSPMSSLAPLVTR